MAAITANPGPPGLALSNIDQYLDDRKWLFFERGMMVTWSELKLLSQLSNDPTQSIIGPTEGRYFYRKNSQVVQPPVLSRDKPPNQTYPVSNGL